MVHKMFVKQNNNILFTNVVKVAKNYNPQPASLCLPDWYKKQISYIGNKKAPIEKGTTTATIKKCIPVFDALTSGYILFTPVDIYVKTVNGEPVYSWSDLDMIKFHPISQAENHPAQNGSDYAKFSNPWSIKTPKGYSTLFTHPFHRDLPFRVLEGVVDTDTYVSPVNFPFVLNDPSWEGLIPAGTPMAQVIPFKREKWKMQISQDTTEFNNNQALLNSTFFNRYKNFFWKKKEFK
jgi:hypothetical protein